MNALNHERTFFGRGWGRGSGWGLWAFFVVGVISTLAAEEEPADPFISAQERHRRLWAPNGQTFPPQEEVTLPAELVEAVRSYGRSTVHLPPNATPPPKDSTPQLAALPSSLSASETSLASLRRSPSVGRGQNIHLPLNSNLQVSGYKSLLLQYNKTNYFGRERLSRYYGSSLGGSRFSTGYVGFDFGSSSYDYGGYDYDYGGYGYGGYDSYGLGGSFGSYSSLGEFGGGYGSYGRYSRAEGINVQQELQIGIHGQVGGHTHVAVDYTDAPRAYFGGLDNKQQRIALWYEGNEESILKKAAFGDITLELPNARFLQVNRNLFGAQIITELGGVRLTGFGSRTKGLKGKWRSRGESRRAGAGIGQPILDTSYIRERYYALQLGTDGRVHDGYLPIRQGSEQIFIDDNDGTNNVGGVKTARGYFNRQFPGEDYTLDYQTGRIEFLRPVTPRMTIVAAYEYLGEGGGVVGNPSNPFADDNGDGIVDDEGEPLGYVVLKASGTRGTELRNVYSLGNRNISPTEFELSIWRNGSQSYVTPTGTYSYLQIFGLDKNGDGRVDPETVDFERGLIFFPDPRPFALDAPNHPFVSYRDELANPALYAENPNPKDQVYTIQADYSYRTDEYNLGVLNIIPGSEVVRVNGRQLQRDVDYQMFYDFGSISFNTRLNEFDEIEVEYEYSPFGGQLQQTVAGVWLEYEWKGKENAPGRQPEIPRRSEFSPFVGGDDFEDYSFKGYGSYGFSDYGYGGYGFSFGSGFGSYSRRTYGMIGSSYFNPEFVRGFKISAGYVLNTGQRESLIPDVNAAPSRLQAFDVNTSFGHAFELRRLVNALPFVRVDRFPLQIDFSGEAAFSHNNPNSVGYALIDGMEGARESNALPMYKYQWQVGSVPIHTSHTNDSRVLFQHLFRDDAPSLPRNYFRNVRVSSVQINPMARSTEERLVAEVGYELNDVVAEWGALTYALSAEGVDFSERQSVELWVRVVGDNALTLHLDVGLFNEDADGDGHLDSEDLPPDLEDTNGDGRVDFLDLDSDNLTGSRRFYGNGSLEDAEDRGWEFNHPYGTATRIGQSDKILDTEDLNGDGVLDTLNAYYSMAIPLDALPSEWVKKVNESSGWMFLSVPLSAASDVGLPSWGYVKQVRLWVEKNRAGTVEGKLQVASVEFVGNEWEPGAVTVGTGKVSPDDYLRVSTKDNYNFADYLNAYRQIEDHREFRRLHPLVESTYAFGVQEQKEQTLALAFHLEPNALGVTWKRLSGPRRGDGQDFSKHETLKMWVYGHGTGGTLLLRLSSSLRSASYYSVYSPYSSSGTQEPSVNVFNDLKDYYEYALPLDFTGWKQVIVPFADANRDGHPDAFRVVGNPSIESIGGVVLGVHNTESQLIEGEVWVNEIYLADPIVRSGWARRGNGRIALGNWFTVDLGYADQDKDFENSAGQTSRQYSLYQGYATNTGEYNLTARFTPLSWLPLEYSLRGQESETQNRRGAISTYASGKSRTDNRTFRVHLKMPKIPELGFMVDSQKYWNERRGTEFSDLTIGSFRYGFRSLVELDAEYRHENATVDKSTATATNTLSPLGSYGYYSDNDRIVDSATFSLRLRPSPSFSFQPSYDVRRELQRRDSKTIYGTPSPPSGTLPFTLAEREQRFSLRPTVNRSFFGIRPSVSAQTNFRENWFNEKKDLSVNSNIRVGLSLRLAEVLKLTPKKKPTKESDQTSPRSSLSPTVVKGNSSAPAEPNPSPEVPRETPLTEALSPASPAAEQVSPKGESSPLESPLDLPSVTADPFFREQERLDQLSQYGFDLGQYEDYQLQRGDWMNRGSRELDRSLEARRGGRRDDGFTLWQRSLNSLTFSADYNYDVRDYLRQLDRGVSVREAMELPDEAPQRSQSTQSNRISLRGSFDPLLWVSFSGDASWRNSFTKNIGTPSRQISTNVGGDVKLFNAKNTASVQIRYDYRTADRQSVTSTYGSSVSHEGSLTWRQRWGETRTSLGTRLSLRNQERSGVTSRGVFLTPSLSVDYSLRTQAGWRVPLLRKTLKLDQNLNVTNYFTAIVRRERLGNNRDARSERYQTALQIGYNLSQRVRANFNLSVTYNNDRVEAGRDYLSVSSALLLRGELQ